jgi:hypothetical protein
MQLPPDPVALATPRCALPSTTVASPVSTDLLAALRAGSLTADALVATYCRRLYGRSGNFSEVAERTSLDRRTVKKHVQRLTEP